MILLADVSSLFKKYWIYYIYYVFLCQNIFPAQHF